jgi:hypothetical protein
MPIGVLSTVVFSAMVGAVVWVCLVPFMFSVVAATRKERKISGISKGISEHNRRSRRLISALDRDSVHLIDVHDRRMIGASDYS